MSKGEKVYNSFIEAFSENERSTSTTTDNKGDQSIKKDKKKSNKNKSLFKESEKNRRRRLQRESTRRRLITLKERSSSYQSVVERREELEKKLGKGLFEIGGNLEDNTVEYGIAFEDFVVKGNNRSCAFNHSSVYIIGKISILTRNGEIINKEIPAGFCPSCNCYYITQFDFDSICEYGIPLCQQYTEEEFRQKNIGKVKFAYKAHSVLSTLGYNVGQKDDLSRIQRQDILSLAIDKEIYTIAQLDSFLNWLISSRNYNANMTKAIERWKEDRQFLNSYKKGNCKVVGVKSITNQLKRQYR